MCASGSCGEERTAYWLKTREQLLAKKKVYREKPRPETLAKKKLYYEQNKDKVKAAPNEWHKNHPDYSKEQWEKKGKIKYDEDRKQPHNINMHALWRNRKANGKIVPFEGQKMQGPVY